MGKNTILLFLIGFTWGSFHAQITQIRRVYSFNNTTIEVLVQSNRMQNNFAFPGMKAFIIIVNSGNTLDTIYENDKLRKIPIGGMNDYACFYYIKAADWLNNETLKQFLEDFTKWCYETDYINRNEVHLVWQGSSNKIDCNIFSDLGEITGSVHILSDKLNSDCNTYVANTANEVWQKSQSGKTSVQYEVLDMKEMRQLQNENQQKAIYKSIKKSKGDIFLQITIGSHHIGSQYKTEFDKNTLVDFTNHKTLWNLRAGYYFSNRLYSNVDVALIYSGKQENIDNINWDDPGGITVNGSGYAGAMIRCGLGLGFVAYTHSRLSINTGIDSGIINAIAGGGTANRTIGGGDNDTDIEKQSQKSIYYNIYAGLNYRIGKSFSLNSNLQYNISAFKQPIGSVSAFTGISVNLGLGITISTKNKDE